MSSGTLPSSGLAWRLPAGRQGTQVLMSRQAACCLRYIAEHPGSSSVAVQDGVGIGYAAQVSQVLLRLERGGLIQTPRGKRALNAWELTEKGSETLGALPEGIYE
jgi:hypothetical protein